jgi:hypothetical protein
VASSKYRFNLMHTNDGGKLKSLRQAVGHGCPKSVFKAFNLFGGASVGVLRKHQPPRISYKV